MEDDNNIKKIVVCKDLFAKSETNFETGEKKIKIVGTGNRYQIKKLTTDRNMPKKKRSIINETDVDPIYFTFNSQLVLLNEIKNSIYKTDLKGEFAFSKSQIERKINSYKHQDIDKKILDEDKFINFTETIEKLIECEMKCYYCKKEMYILYELVRENLQWTLDRIDNDKGHNRDNIVISCLECNLKRRRQTKDNFLFTKQLKINKNENDEI